MGATRFIKLRGCCSWRDDPRESSVAHTATRYVQALTVIWAKDNWRIELAFQIHLHMYEPC